MKGNKGITLIALVITIIVLLILAGVSIAMLTGENGILTQAGDAAEETRRAEAEDKIRLALSEYRIQKYTDNEDLKTFLEGHEYGFTVEGEDGGPYTVTLDEYKWVITGEGEIQGSTAEADPKPKISNVTITTDGTTVPTDGTLEEGDTLQINFDTSIEGGTIKSVTPQVPYTTNGTDKEIEFTIVGTVNGTDYTLTQKVSVGSKYRELSEIEKAVKTTEVEVFSEAENTEITDYYGNKIVIPAGFGIAEDSGLDVTQGVVIEEAGVTGGGNQFVWIPVSVSPEPGENKEEKIIKTDNSGGTATIELSRYEFDENGMTTAKGLTEDVESVGSYNDSKYLEEQTSTKGNTVAKNLGEFISKTEASGGYYIARYEASEIDNKVASQSNKTPWTSITQSDAATAASGMYTSDKYTSDLINSLAWDTALVYIQTFSDVENAENYSNQGSENNSELNTGISGDVQCNIYDMASNVREWSTETSTYLDYPCVSRSGYYNSRSIPASFRAYSTRSRSLTYIGFRTLLYL